MKIKALFLTGAILLSPSIVFAGAEVVCDDKVSTAGGSPEHVQTADGSKINSRIIELKKMGIRNVQITHLTSSSTSIPVRDNTFALMINKVCAALSY